MAVFSYLSLSNKKRKVTQFDKMFIGLVVTNSHLFLFAFNWNMAFMCMSVYNSKSYEYFWMSICRSCFFCHSFFNFVNMRFLVKVIFFPIKLYKKI